MTSDITLEEDHAVVCVDGIADQMLEYGDEAQWQATAMALSQSSCLTVIVPSSATFKLALPRVPHSRRELRKMLTLLAPLRLRDLLWTSPAPVGSGPAASVTLVRRDWLDHRTAAFRHHVARTGLVIVDAERVPFMLVVPSDTNRRWEYGLAVTAIGLAAITWIWQLSRPEDREPSASFVAAVPLSDAAVESSSATASARGPSASAARTNSALILLGIAGRLPDNADALIRTPWGQTSTLRIGDSLLGWKLISIASDRVILEKDGARDELVLEPIP